MNALGGPVSDGAKAGPLHGIRVLELGQYIAAPFAAKILGDLGADVIKVESPQGDPMRRWEGSVTYSPQFGAYNRNKRGVVLDLKSADGVERLRALALAADVVIDNFRPGVMARLGLAPDALKTLNPKLVTCSITGFGAEGPHAAKPSYDTVISAVGGMYSQVSTPGVLRPIGPAFSDLLAGMSAAQAITAALVARDTSGVGEHIDITMIGSLIDFLTEATSTFLSTGAVSGPGTRSRRAQAFALAGSDDAPFIVHLSVPEKFWKGLLAVLDRPDLADDPRFVTRDARVDNYDALDAELKAVASTRPRQYWLDRLTEHDIPHGPLNTIDALFDDPQIALLNLLTPVATLEGEQVQVPLHSARFSESGRREYHCAPALSDVTDEPVDWLHREDLDR